jgi:hypothetical protein
MMKKKLTEPGAPDSIRDKKKREKRREKHMSVVHKKVVI